MQLSRKRYPFVFITLQIQFHFITNYSLNTIMQATTIVHLIRTPEYTDSAYHAVMKILRSVNGQIIFKEGPSLEMPTDYYCNRWHNGFHFEGYAWSAFFLTMAQFRRQYQVPDNHYVCLLTNLPNVLRWFGALDDLGKNNFFIDAERLSKYMPQAPNHAVAYHIAASLLRKQMRFDASAYRYFAHTDPSGCVNDFCLDKRDVQLKLQSAKICPTCAKKLAEEEVNLLLLGHIQAIFRHVQDFLCNNQATTNLYTFSRLTLTWDGNLYLTDYKVEIPLAQQEKALYLLFLHHEKGLYCYEIENHREELRAIYQKIGGTDTKAADQMIDNPSHLSVIFANIKSKIKAVIGNLPPEVLNAYLISSTGKKKINLDRKYLDLPNDIRALFTYFG